MPLNEPAAQIDDDRLVLRAKSDRAAFGELFDRYYPHVMRYCLRRSVDRAAAEDVTSDVFLQVATHIAAFAGTTDTDFRRWLFRIATNAVAAQHRQSHRRAELWHAAVDRRAIGQGDATPLPDTQYHPLDWPTVRAAIDELDEREQTIVNLRFFADCSHQDISEIVGATAGAVRTALVRALAQLRRRLQPELHQD